MRWTVGAKLGLGFGLALAILLVIGIASYLGTRTLMETNRWEIHTHLVLGKLENVLSLLKDTETGQRGYIITGQQRYLEPYDQAVKQIASEMKGIRELTADNSNQQVRLDALELLITAKLGELKETIDLRKTEGFEATRQLVLTEKGKIIMDEIRKVIGDMENEENLLLEERADEAEATARSTTLIILGGTLSAFLLLSVVGFLIARNITKPLREIAKVSEGVASGDFSLRVANYGRSDEVGILAESFRNMVERRERAEEELRNSQRRFAGILEIAQDAIISLDEAQRITLFNQGAEKIFGYTAQSILGQRIDVLLPSRFVDVHRKHIEEFARSSDLPRKMMEGEREIWGRRKDGTEFPADASISRLDLGGKKVLTVMLRDITERRKAQEELKQAKEVAEEASRAKSEFLANMSHEIRTPMNGVIGMTGLLLDTDLTAEQREYAETVRNSADALLTIINDILDFSKIEAGKLTIEPIPFDLRGAVEETAELHAVRAQEKDLDLIVRYALDAPSHLIGDPGRIRQVLTNLVANAIKFTKKGHVLINVECEEQSDGEARLRLSVQDTGPGIPEDKLPQIFDKFTQADVSTTRKYGGTGLGLAICKQLAELMGGTVGATSRPGEGATFWFTLRLPLDAEGPGAPLPSADLKGVRVLIADNNEINRRVLQEQLASWSLRTQGFASGEEVLTALRQAHAAGDPYQIALLDYRMPSMDGETLGRAIKADPLLRETVLVMLTSFGQRGDAKRFKQAGFAAYLVKPVRQSQLMNALATVWEARTQGRPTELLTRHTLAESRTAKTVSPTTKGKTLGMRVLVAEDNIVNQRVAVRMLEKLGCRVDVAANGKEAVEMLEILPYNLVFMDCQMPETDGFEATAEIRRREKLSGLHVPIIAMTAAAMRGDRERCLQAGMDDYLAKPIQPNELRAAVERHRSTPAAVGEGTRPKQPASEIVDRATVLARVGGDVEVLREVVGLFLDNCPKLLSEIREAVARGDDKALARAAHTLKGSVSNFAAKNAFEAALKLETMGMEADLTGAEDAYAFLEAEITRLKPALAAIAEKRA